MYIKLCQFEHYFLIYNNLLNESYHMLIQILMKQFLAINFSFPTNSLT